MKREENIIPLDAQKGQGRHIAPIGELLEHTGEDRLDSVEDVLLGDEAHLEIELIELTRRAVGAAVLVAKTGRDLEVAIEAGDHQELLESLIVFPDPSRQNYSPVKANDFRKKQPNPSGSLILFQHPICFYL